MSFYQFINHDRKFIAFFSPKCACTTLKWWFAESLENDNIKDHQDLNKYHVAASDVINYPEYTKILFIRNPHKRLVSYYCKFVVNYFEYWGYADHDREFSLKDKTFSEFLHTLEDLWKIGARLQHHLVPQLHGLEFIKPDMVIRVEEMDWMLANISHNLGFEYSPKRHNSNTYVDSICEPVWNRTPDWLNSRGSPRYEYFFNEKLKYIVNRIYSADLICYENNAAGHQGLGTSK